MTGTPACRALLMTAVPLALSRLSMMRTLTPWFSMPSAIVWNWLVSPWAFWIVYLTPAALNAAWRLGRSWVSYRAEDLVSGRMTPTNGVAAAAPVVVVASPAGDAELFELPQPATAVTASRP